MTDLTHQLVKTSGLSFEGFEVSYAPLLEKVKRKTHRKLQAGALTEAAMYHHIKTTKPSCLDVYACLHVFIWVSCEISGKDEVIQVSAAHSTIYFCRRI